MKVRQLGNSGLYVSEFALGTMTFGMPEWGCDEDVAVALIHRYLDAGGNFFDTADIYGPAGVSEEICGRALKHNRAEIVLATKVGMPAGAGPHERGTSRIHIKAACEASLRRLQTDYIDLYQLHVDDEATPLEETISALDDLVRDGKVLYTGASNFRAYRLMKALAISDRLAATRFISLQGQYSLVVRSMEREHLRLLEEEGLGFISWSPLAAGMLTGKISREDRPEGTRLGQRDNPLTAMYKSDRGYEIATFTKQCAAELGCTPAQLALAWQRTRPVTSVILGARTIEQLDDNLAALDITIPSKVVADLDAATGVPDEYPGMFIDIVGGMLRGADAIGTLAEANRPAS